MREQASIELALGFVDKGTLGGAAVVGLVVFESEVGDVIAKGIKEMIVKIMLSAEKSVRLSHEFLVRVPDVLRWFEGGGAVGRDIQFGGRLLGERNNFQILAGQDWRIDEDV